MCFVEALKNRFPGYTNWEQAVGAINQLGLEIKAKLKANHEKSKIVDLIDLQ